MINFPKGFFEWVFRLAFIGVLTIVLSAIGLVSFLIYLAVHHLRLV